jgi:hypothetical protein
MMAAPGGNAVRIVNILIIDDDGFEAGYVSSTLEPHGINPIGPFAEVHDVIAAIDTSAPCGAIIGHQNDYQGRMRIVGALEERGIPYLTLLRPVGSRLAGENRPVLRKPFAGYQVAEWVLKNCS